MTNVNGDRYAYDSELTDRGRRPTPLVTRVSGLLGAADRFF
jgi:hypothetical protein